MVIKKTLRESSVLYQLFKDPHSELYKEYFMDLYKINFESDNSNTVSTKLDTKQRKISFILNEKYYEFSF